MRHLQARSRALTKIRLLMWLKLIDGVYFVYAVRI
jgi:hypothetical protein